MFSLAMSRWRHICPVPVRMPLSNDAEQHGPDAAPAHVNPDLEPVLASLLATDPAGRAPRLAA